MKTQSDIHEKIDCSRRSRRGESNALRKGKSKIHRRYAPSMACTVPRGMASKVVARMGNHNWHKNAELIALRREGYTPYTKRNDPNFSPKPMRVSTRSESCEALNVLSLVLSANCDYNPDSDCPFEIMQSFEQLAASMGMLHQYENGRKAYDSPLHALSVMEQLSYVVILRGKDTDSGHNKPLRIWLTDKFFTSRGIQVEEIRQWLGQFRSWAIRKGLTESMRKKYERHLLRVGRIGISLKDRHSLRNRLKQIKRWVVSPDLQQEKAAKVGEMKTALNEQEGNSSRIDWVLDKAQRKIRNIVKAKQQCQNPYYQAFVKWSTSSTVSPIHVMHLENCFKQDMPGLKQQDPESYYKALLERAGVPI